MTNEPTATMPDATTGADMIFDSPANLSGQSRTTRTCPPSPKPAQARPGAAVDRNHARIVGPHENARRAGSAGGRLADHATH